jgi:hypothetical protein
VQSTPLTSPHLTSAFAPRLFSHQQRQKSTRDPGEGTTVSIAVEGVAAAVFVLSIALLLSSRGLLAGSD